MLTVSVVPTRSGPPPPPFPEVIPQPPAPMTHNASSAEGTTALRIRTPRTPAPLPPGDAHHRKQANARPSRESAK
ncbi:hypothetical protein GCM10010507_39080 [Streptomyces cinnamoneus]|uniref:Uncharacterized protein n=1 Tax=Streptomyces cinnamoneus TaxID=53446 RepID=A0A918TVJ0_STRCJ|nr:hypothetical protein GCM10010507_39080 [Streptomyces cinnamoneus]